MRCSEFRAQHCAFVDDTLAGVELIRMQRHTIECQECAAYDTKIRRSLILAHSLPHVVLSPGFSRRLEARLKACQGQPDSVAYANFRTIAAIGAVASFLMLGYVANVLYRAGASSKNIVLPPVVAMATTPQPNIVLIHPYLPISSPTAITVSAPAETPIWPNPPFTALEPLHFVGYQQVH